VLGTWRLQTGRTNFLTALGGNLYWLTDGRHARPDIKAPLRRVERLATATGHVSVVADSGAGEFSGIAAGADALAVVVDRPAPLAACGAAARGATSCASPVFEALEPGGGMRALATSAAQPQYAEGGYSIDQIMSGVLFETLHHGHRSVAWWKSTDEMPRTVVSDAPFSAGITVVGTALVGQLYGVHRLWTVGGPRLPASAARGGIDPTGSATHLAWYTSPDSERGFVYVATRHDHGYTAPVRVTRGDVYVLDWASDCLLYIRESTGLFLAYVCQPGAPRVEQLLTADQSERIYNPAQFATAPGRFAFAVTVRGAEVLVLLQTPTA
jgi:hypothetical protein